MGIRYFEEERIFKLDTRKSSYMIGIVDDEQFLGHVYFGRRLPDDDMRYLLRTEEPPYVPSKNNGDRLAFYDSIPMEYPVHGIGDFRENCISVRSEGGHEVLNLRYSSYEIFPGKKALKGLPATYGETEECTTLELTMRDELIDLTVVLSYTAFEELDVITRSVRVINSSDKDIVLTKVLSTCLDIEGMDYDVISLHGAWIRECGIQRRRLGFGKFSTSSCRGESSHQANPFMAIAGSDATEDMGEVIGFNFVYSGNFIATAEGTPTGCIRAVMGINPDNFSYKLEPDDDFQAPEIVMVYSSEGIGGMTRTFHDLYRKHLIRGNYKDSKRPILINNWEATYFDFDTEKLLGIARDAAKLGIEMLVMDDGWFGKRNSDTCALGDWVVNEDKLKGGLKYLVDEVNKLGLKFGIWFEPEMISPDSDLYRAHPDWAIQVPGRVAGLCREQYVLDLSRRDVIEHTYESIKKILKSANITYVKWDMNRQLADLGSFELPADRQGELSHRYVLGVYELQDRLTKEFPYLLLENCSGGGARFDPGMLYYSPQIWCSDDTDAIERLKIQRGTSMVYPLSAMGAHVSDCPNHAVGRTTPFETRGYVALAGTFGYELDVTRISEADRAMIPEQVAMYHKYNDLVRRGDYYRIAGVADNGQYDAYMVVAKDKEEALVTYIQVLGRPIFRSRRLKLKGLDETKTYEIEETGQKLSGAALMEAGILIGGLHGDFKGKLVHIVGTKSL